MAKQAHKPAPAPAPSTALVVAGPLQALTSAAPAPLPATPAPGFMAAYKAGVAAAQAVTPAPQALPTGRGAATAARWFGPALKANPNAVCLTKAQVLALAPSTVITCNVNRNPKGGASNPVFALYFGKQPLVGAQTTWGAFVAAMAKGGNGVAPSTPAIAAGHVVWDISRGFISLAQ